MSTADSASYERSAAAASVARGRYVTETLHFGWWPVEDEDSPSLCTCGHLHFLRKDYERNQVTWRYCEDPECRCRCLTRAKQAKRSSLAGETP